MKLLGMVNAEPDFSEHPTVINGCSDLLVEILGEAGRHARSAVGMGSLPNRMTVEIEAILLISELNKAIFEQSLEPNRHERLIRSGVMPVELQRKTAIDEMDRACCVG